jgi:hypothetical protein
MPADSGQSIDSTNTDNLAITPVPDPTTPAPEIEVKEISVVGDTPNPAQGLPPVEGRRTVEGRPQGSPLLYTFNSAF